MYQRALAIIVCLVLSLDIYANCLNSLRRLHIRQSVTKSFFSESDDAFMRRIDKIENTSSWLRNLKKDKQPAIHVKMQKKLAKLDANLFVADYATAHRDLRVLFREVEFSSLAIMAINKQLESV